MKKRYLFFFLINLAIAIFVGILMVIIGISHNMQGEFYITNDLGKISSIDFGYIFLIFLSWFLSILVPIQLVGGVVVFIKNLASRNSSHDKPD